MPLRPALRPISARHSLPRGTHPPRHPRLQDFQALSAKNLVALAISKLAPPVRRNAIVAYVDLNAPEKIEAVRKLLGEAAAKNTGLWTLQDGIFALNGAGAAAVPGDEEVQGEEGEEEQEEEEEEQEDAVVTSARKFVRNHLDQVLTQRSQRFFQIRERLDEAAGLDRGALVANIDTALAEANAEVLVPPRAAQAVALLEDIDELSAKLAGKKRDLQALMAS
jgi:hypothetical protein